MTRATLLHALDRPTALGPAEVRELEQLAQAFPYCQTAHLLLAKAAHDQGTMLAGQRLRRAATYAADRTLLRRLIEQGEPAVQAGLITVAAPTAGASPEPEPTVAQQAADAPYQLAGALVEAAPLPPAALAVPTAAGSPVTFAPTGAPASEIAPLETAPVVVTSPILAAVAPIAIAAAPAPVPPAVPILEAAIESAPESPALEAVTSTAPVIAAIAETEIEAAQVTEAAHEAEAAIAHVAEVTLPPLVDQEGAEIAAAAFPIEGLADLEAVQGPAPRITEEAETVGAPLAVEEDLPAQAPAIRPPVEVGEARFEFGLAEEPLLPVSTYELPGLVDEWAAAAVTLSLGSPEFLAAPALAQAAAPIDTAFTPAAFTGDAAVGYAFGESSRLGLAMQLLDLLTARAEAAESSTAVVAAAQPPASALPPTGTFFDPDPMLLDHWATHRPLPPALPSSLDLINNFLKRQPRLTRPGMLPPSPAAQADLSVRSTRAEPDLASETLARILVRQGKPLSAIEIYKKLMVKQPEKMAYFAAQIQSLQPSA